MLKEVGLSPGPGGPWRERAVLRAPQNRQHGGRPDVGGTLLSRRSACSWVRTTRPSSGTVPVDSEVCVHLRGSPRLVAGQRAPGGSPVMP